MIGIGVIMGAGIGALVAIGAASALFVIQSIAILAGTYATSDALGPLGAALFLLIFFLAPAVLVGAVLGGAVGFLVAALRAPSSIRTAR